MLTTAKAASIIKCAKCGGVSHLRIVSPSVLLPDHDERLFTCQSCGHSETIVVKAK